MNSEPALQTALGLLARRSYSEQEIHQKLRRKGYEQEVIEKVAEYLLRRGYLDDTALCQLLTGKYLRYGQYSRRVIIQKLKQRGIAQNIIENVLLDYEQPDEFDTALILCTKHFRHRDKLQFAQLVRYLQYRGFNQETICRVWEKLRE